MTDLPKRFRSPKYAPGVVDVAIRAGVSPATVSRCFMTPEIVNEATRKRVLSAASALGYVRERSEGTARHRFSGTIGLVVPTIDNAIFAELAASFSKRLEALGRTMLIASHEYDLTSELEIVRSLVERRIDGVAVIGFDHAEVPLKILSDRRIPVLSLWNYRSDSDLPCIGADNFEAGRIVAEHVLGLGRQDIAYLFPETTDNDRARDRLAGALSAAETRGLAPPDNRVLACPYEIGAAKALAIEIIREGKPDAFLCGNDVIAQGVLYACQALGVVVPGTVVVAGIGDFRGSGEIEPGLTTVRMPARTIGDLGATTLVEMSQTGAPPRERNRKIPLQLIVRKSTKTLGGNRC